MLANTQVSKICEAFANGSIANIKFSKIKKKSKIKEIWEILDKLLGPLIKTGLPLKNLVSL